MAVETIDTNAASRDFWRGARLSFPVVLATIPFSLLFGALAVDNGMSVFEAVLMSATIYGGASQMVGIELFGQKIAPWLDRAVDLRRQFPSRALFGGVIGPRIGHWPSSEAGDRLSSCLTIRNSRRPR